MDKFTLWCYVQGDLSYFEVSVSSSQTISCLRKEIYDEKRNFFITRDASDLILSKIDVDPEDPAISFSIESGQYQRPLNSTLLKPMSKIANVWPGQPPDNHLHVYISLPSQAGSSTLVYDEAIMLSDPQNGIPPELTITLQNFEDWDCLTQLDLTHNGIARDTLNVQVLQDTQKSLRDKRYVSENVRTRFWDFTRTSDSALTIPLGTLVSHFCFEITTSSAADTTLRQVTGSELMHYMTILGPSGLTNRERYMENKEWSVRHLLRGISELDSSQTQIKCGFGVGYILPLLIKIVNNNQTETKYAPHNDFHLSIRQFPHIILEVNSQVNEGDENRMLLQAACLCRKGNQLRNSDSDLKDTPVIIMAIYISKEFKARQHLLCQPDVNSKEVKYISKSFNLADSQAAFEFFFELYNFLSYAETDNARLVDPEVESARIKQLAERKGYPTFSGLKRTRDEDNKKLKKAKKSKPDLPTQREQVESLDNPSALRAVRRAEYALVSDELTPLTPLKPTMRLATLRRGPLLVLKIIADPNEHRLLEYFNGIKATSNHTIPLLDTLYFSKGTIIVLPWKSPLDEVLQFRGRGNDVVSLCRQFVEGVAFLHQHNVAHCDLKPENVVVDCNYKAESGVSLRLFIIDFGLALSVESEETTTEDWRGTQGWTAPELGSIDGPIKRYSPILADRWACGKMIGHFAKYVPTHGRAEKKALEDVAQRLLNPNPGARPKLNQLGATRKRKLANDPYEAIKKHGVPALKIGEIAA